MEHKSHSVDVAIYTHGHEAAVLASHARRTAENSCAYLLGRLAAGMSVLDIGCGPGTITCDLAARVAPGKVLGVDSAPDSIIAARQTAAERGDTTTEFTVADASALALPDDSFDVVHAHQVLQHVSDPVAVLREMYRVCRPGGIIAVRDADYAAMAWYPQVQGLDQWRQAYRTIARANGGEPDAGRHYRRWANEAGLAGNAEFGVSTWNYATDTECRWWGHSQAARVGGPAFREQAAVHGIDDEAVDAMVEAWSTWGSGPDSWFLMPHAEMVVIVDGSGPQPQR